MFHDVVDLAISSIFGWVAEPLCSFEDENRGRSVSQQIVCLECGSNAGCERQLSGDKIYRLRTMQGWQVRGSQSKKEKKALVYALGKIGNKKGSCIIQTNGKGRVQLTTCTSKKPWRPGFCHQKKISNYKTPNFEMFLSIWLQILLQYDYSFVLRHSLCIKVHGIFLSKSGGKKASHSQAGPRGKKYEKKYGSPSSL